jgi:hypothetical protein
MTASSIQKFTTYLYDASGKPIMLQLDLKNKKFKKFVEDMIEDYEDTLTAMERDNDDTISSEEVEKRVFALHNEK